MPRSSTQELDLRIQLSLVTSIRHAASAYHAAPATGAPAALEAYLSALESLAEYVATKWRGERISSELPVAGQRVRTHHSTARITQFAPTPDSYREPVTANSGFMVAPARHWLSSTSIEIVNRISDRASPRYNPEMGDARRGSAAAATATCEVATASPCDGS